MDGLNYHHLLYFWKVAKTGSIAKASVELKLTQPTISEQIRLLETSFDRKLFDRAGRSLALTAEGEKVYGYAEKIFAIGSELEHAMRGEVHTPSPVLKIGIEAGFPDDIAATLVAAALRVKPRPELDFRHDSLQPLLAALSNGELQLVLTMSGANKSGNHAHLLIDCGTIFLAKGKRSKGWPAALNDGPVLLPASKIGEDLESWFRAHRFSPEIAARSNSSALLRKLCDSGAGILAAPDSKLPKNHGLTVLGRAADIRWRLYAVTRERRPRNPYVTAVLAKAKRLNDSA